VVFVTLLRIAMSSCPGPNSSSSVPATAELTAPHAAGTGRAPGRPLPGDRQKAGMTAPS
jgi:hypothetical protein